MGDVVNMEEERALRDYAAAWGTTARHGDYAVCSYCCEATQWRLYLSGTIACRTCGSVMSGLRVTFLPTSPAA